jgi:hypothetical protein
MSKPQVAKAASEYDEAKLESMTEPLTMTIEKMIAGRPQPVELPIKPGESIAGVGWTKNDVRELPTFLGRKGTGSGLVKIKVTDVNQVVMKWEWFFSPQDYAPLPAMSNAPDVAPSQLPVGATAQPLQGAQMQQPAQVYQDPYGGWLGTVSRQGTTRVPASFASPLRSVDAQGGQMTNPALQGYPQFAVPPGIIQTSGSDDRLRDEREARLRLEADMARQALENRYKEQIGGVSGEVRQLQQAIGQISQLIQAPRPEEAASAATRSLQAKIDSLEASQREDKMLAMMQASQAQTAALIASMQASTEKQITAMQQQMAAAATAKPSGPDPTMMMMMESQKTAQQSQMQFMQMLMQQQQQQQTAQSQGQLGTRETIELMRSMNTGAEQQATAFSKAWELMMQGVETILHAQGPGVHPAVEMLGQGIAAAAGIGERFVEMKDSVGKQQANAQIMQANAMQAQAQANMHLAGQLQAQRQQAQLSGAVAAPVVTAQPEQPEQPEEGGEEEEGEEEGEEGEEKTTPETKPSVAGGSTGHAKEVVMDDVQRAERARQDRESFGPALSSIKRLRKGITDGHLDSQAAAMAIIQGVEEIVKRKGKVPAIELWKAGQLAECIELMIPDTSMSFRERVIDAIVAFVQQATAQQQGGG